MALAGRHEPPCEHVFSPHDAVPRTAAPHVARRRPLTVTAAAPMLAFSTHRPSCGGTTAAELEAARITDDPFGGASGDPLPGSVLIWTRLAPEPFADDGGLGRQRVVAHREVALGEWFAVVEQQGAATARPSTPTFDGRRGWGRMDLGHENAQVGFRTVSAITTPEGSLATTAPFVTEVGSPGPTPARGARPYRTWRPSQRRSAKGDGPGHRAGPFRQGLCGASP
ncbi:PhoD-like phosphatase N-terminal domain-containing protein [Streptomyces sp. NPDC002788]